jgi:ADP-ribose pyrophosphatase YjhB (NUDIX family)
VSILDWARQVQAIALNGLAFTHDQFDRERFQQLRALTDQILADELGLEAGRVRGFWAADDGYVTPKVDVRGAVFQAERILLVRERSDGNWTLPGGWVDVNDAPSFAVEREIREESGYTARATRLAALWDKNQPAHGHPPGIHHIYKLFFICELTGGAPAHSNETDGVDFFALHALPPLSLGRATPSQIARLFEHMHNPSLPTDFD